MKGKVMEREPGIEHACAPQWGILEVSMVLRVRCVFQLCNVDAVNKVCQ